MNTFVTGVGWFVIAALSVALACLAVCCVLWMFDKAMERFEIAVTSKTRVQIGRSIDTAKHWFSENPETFVALRILAERITNGMGVDPSQWREEWRNELKRRQAASE